jgi:hypothetical protein
MATRVGLTEVASLGEFSTRFFSAQFLHVAKPFLVFEFAG